MILKAINLKMSLGVLVFYTSREEACDIILVL